MSTEGGHNRAHAGTEIQKIDAIVSGSFLRRSFVPRNKVDSLDVHREGAIMEHSIHHTALLSKLAQESDWAG